LGEYQIRGKHVNELAEIEHIPYDLRQGKDISKGIPALRRIFEPVKTAAQAMDDAQYAQYNAYLADMYEYSRMLEMGLKPAKPKFPEGLNEIVKIESLEQLHHQSNLIIEGEKLKKYALPLAIGGIQTGVVNIFDKEKETI